MFRRSLIISTLFLSLTSITLSACSSSTTDGTTAATSGSKSVGAAGGTVEAAGATLTIPVGALAGDTTITFEQKSKAGMPMESDIVAPVYDFGPTGTTFIAPVTLKMDFTGTVPAGKTAKLAWLDTTKNVWTVLTDSSVSGSAVSGTTTHFTAFTVVFSGDGTQTGGSCAGIPFTACGGNIVGTWTYDAACATIKGGTKGFETCTAASYAVTVDLVGTATFAADGKFSSASTIATSIKSTIPKSCLAAGATCGGLMATDTGTACESTQTQAPKDNSSTGETYTTTGNILVINNGKSETIEYCVSGNTLTAKVDSSGATIVYRAKKN
ncbi:MAG: hypothetical protein SGI86_05700 [Deltaproteobacteria bacterium]|nr:hypothetical protein [Deltaproteobacteria bacterium]